MLHIGPTIQKRWIFGFFAKKLLVTRMDCLHKDIVDIIYRLIHNDLYSKVINEFSKVYVYSMWDDSVSLYWDTFDGVVASWRSRVDIKDCRTIHDMLGDGDIGVQRQSKRGGVLGYLPKNY